MSSLICRIYKKKTKQTHREQAYGCQMGGADGEKIKQEKQI